MKKLITLILTLLMCSLSFGADIQGQGNTVIFSDYITDVYYEIAGFISIDNAYRFADSTMVKNRINAAREKTVVNLGGTERDTTFAIGTSTEEYALPSDFYMVNYVTSIAINTGHEVAMKEVSGAEYGLHRDDTGTPAFYLIDKRKIYVVPCNTSNDSIVVHYRARSNTLSANTDTCNIDKEYKNYIVLTTAEMIMRGKAPSMGAYGQARLEEIAVAKEKEEKRLLAMSKSLYEIMSK